ncbi:MAG: hypothetical protein EPN70_21835 [Paraburkholderia sp.]|uniref:hypothetical protein n=1 Tax=Paraburkholderia sp. TaxID=1926495 RepID=UPI00121A41A4|nr:hypothetical protein [Paraburkholderia sp.]TAM00615.1 MAG: hypothetical protein EPN70_21835 [Paraburkholderia sp.]TAM31453.1 MAG: hypothetical protein EPN59_04720 [Paraburkholderia sp.]
MKSHSLAPPLRPSDFGSIQQTAVQLAKSNVASSAFSAIEARQPDGDLVGIASWANLIHALATVPGKTMPSQMPDDSELCE